MCSWCCITVLLFNIKEIKEIFTEESYKIKIDECMNKYINSIFTEEHIFLYLFKDCIAFSDLKTDYGENTEKIIISGYFTGIGKPLSLNFNKPINDYYYKFWEYFSLTQFFKDNYFKYLDYFNSARVNRSYSAIYKLVDKIVLFIPIKSIRNRIRNNILKDMDELIKI